MPIKFRIIILVCLFLPTVLLGVDGTGNYNSASSSKVGDVKMVMFNSTSHNYLLKMNFDGGAFYTDNSIYDKNVLLSGDSYYFLLPAGYDNTAQFIIGRLYFMQSENSSYDFDTYLQHYSGQTLNRKNLLKNINNKTYHLFKFKDSPQMNKSGSIECRHGDKDMYETSYSKEENIIFVKVFDHSRKQFII
jgi:hypothetical protein